MAEWKLIPGVVVKMVLFKIGPVPTPDLMTVLKKSMSDHTEQLDPYAL